MFMTKTPKKIANNPNNEYESKSMFQTYITNGFEINYYFNP